MNGAKRRQSGVETERRENGAEGKRSCAQTEAETEQKRNRSGVETKGGGAKRRHGAICLYANIPDIWNFSALFLD